MRAFVGVLFVLLGAFLLLYTYAFASMIDPAVSDAEWRSALLFKMFLQSGIAGGAYLGIGLIVAGLVIALGKWNAH
jgi:hypothetical protein